MSKGTKILAIGGAYVTASVILCMSIPIIAQVINLAAMLPELCFWGVGDVKQPEQMAIERRRILLGDGKK